MFATAATDAAAAAAATAAQLHSQPPGLAAAVATASAAAAQPSYGLAPIGSLGGQSGSWPELGDLNLSLLVASQLPQGAGAPAAAGAGPPHLLYDTVGYLAPGLDASEASSLFALQATAAGALGGAGTHRFHDGGALMGGHTTSGLLPPPQPTGVGPSAAAAAAARQAYLDPASLQLPPHYLAHHFDAGLHFPPGSIRTGRPHLGGGGGGSSCGTPGSRSSQLDGDSPHGGGSDSGGSTPVKKTRRGCRGGRQKRWFMAQQMAAAAAINGASGVSSYDMFRVLSGAANPAGLAQPPRYPGSA